MTQAHSSRPVFLIAFANPAAVDRAYLRGLGGEEQRLRDALERTENCDDWEVKCLTATRLGDLLDIFQDAQWRGRIAFLHYGGHAGPNALHLEDGAGATRPIPTERLAAFLKEQPGLQFVFLNACHTENFSSALRKSGIPAVVATSRAVSDATATEFAARFYGALAGGANLRSAFQQAEEACRMMAGENFERTVRRDAADLDLIANKLRQDREWPWKLEAANRAAEEWSFADATHNPLFGVPPLPPITPPAGSPYRGLERFKREHAALFFGRSRDVATLYRQLGGQKAGITLLHGASGAGKSSLIEAGLLPRLDEGFRVVCVRRTRERGLAGDLLAALEAKDGAMLADRWLELEQDKPLLVVLDQAEESFTRPMESDTEARAEWAALTVALAPLFGRGVRPPRGKLFLSFRKEWLPEIERRVRELTDTFTRVFLAPLDRTGVLEAITGPTTLRDAGGKPLYPLEISEGVAEAIADKLIPDRDSPLAPTLQILLEGLWNAAGKAPLSPAGARAFTPTLLDEQIRRGTHLRDFLRDQLKAVENAPGLTPATAEAIRAGLALDLLAFHVTPEITAETRTLPQIENAYGPNRPAIAETLPLLVNARLLTDPVNTPDATPRTRLAHDALAPLVREAAEISHAPGPRAQRILRNWQANWSGETGTEPRLTWMEMRAIEKGRAGMRALDASKEKLMRDTLTFYAGVAFSTFFTFAFVSLLFFWGIYKIFDSSRNQPLEKKLQEIQKKSEAAKPPKTP